MNEGGAIMIPDALFAAAEAGARDVTPAAAPPSADSLADGGRHVQMELAAQDAPAVEPLRPPPPPAGTQPLENAKHEAFCEHVTGWGGTGDAVAAYRAYMEVYGTTNEATACVNASRLAARDDVRERCAWMRGQLANSCLLDKAAVRATLFKKRMDIIEKTQNTKHKDVAIAAMRDVERSLGLDGPEVERSTTTEESAEKRAAAAELIGQNVEAVAAALIAKRVTVRTVVNE
jgi:hypothetical protein